MTEKNPFESNNGLRVTGRTSQSISLEWPMINTFEYVEEEVVVVEVVEAKSDKKAQKGGKGKEVKVKEEDEESAKKRVVAVGRDGNWCRIEMRKELTNDWDCVYQGYANKCTIDGLAPDLALLFRMKRNQEMEWGSEVQASTAPAPASTEDLNRAVEMNSGDLVSRILNFTRPQHLKKILQARDRNGMTPLMVACHIGNVRIAEKLILTGCDINAQSSGTGRTALMMAAIVGHQTVIVLLDKHKANWRIRDRSGLNVMDYAVTAGHLATVKLAFRRMGTKCVHEKDERHGWTPLMRAAVLSNSLDVLRFLVARGAIINSTDKLENKSVLLAAVIGKKPDFVRFLLGKGADPYFQNLKGKNCLEMARILGYREITEILTEHIKTLEQERTA